MAKGKKKTNIQVTSVKSNNAVLKKGVKTTVVNNKKTRQTKKKLEVVEEIKKEKKPVKKATVKKSTKTTPKKVINPVDAGLKSSNLTKDEVIAKRKERNRKKYEKTQQKYRGKKEKKKITVEDKVEEKKEFIPIVPEEPKIEFKEVIKEEPVKKASKDEKETPKKQEEKKRKEKRKTNRKTSGFTQTLIDLKDKSINVINDVREKTNDDSIPAGKTIIEKTKRSKRFIKEAIVYAIILTIIDVLCIVFLDYFDFLRLFDVKALNIVLTILIALIFNFFVAFMVDYFITNIWLVKRRKKKDGELSGNSRTNEEEYWKDIKN